MNLTIFAATGGVGRHVLTQAIAKGHKVTAVARMPEKLLTGVLSLKLDLAAPDPAVLAAAIQGADAVIACLGARSASEIGIVSTGTKLIVTAMKRANVYRIVVVSSALAATMPSPGRANPPRFDPGDEFVMRYIVSPLLKTARHGTLGDLAQMEATLRDSGLDWTAIRPPALNDRPLTGTYRISYGQNVRGGRMISRANVADLMLRVLTQPEAIRQTIGIAA